MAKHHVWISVAALVLAAAPAHAGLTVRVSDATGQAVADAVVYAEPSGAGSATKSASAEIEQKEKRFIPLVTVVQTGTAIAFPNNDTVRHHAYSFSPARPFELKLYSGKPAAPILFDKAGTVVIGCNIHDHMIAYVQVVETPYFGKTDDHGVAHLNGLPPGKYLLKTWHYKQPNDIRTPEQALQVEREDGNIAVRLGYSIN